MISLKTIKRVVILVVGGTVLLLGVALIALPGPAFVVIPAGLAILAIEFRWARNWLRSERAILPLNFQKLFDDKEEEDCVIDSAQRRISASAGPP
jgi:uncharacterized protein (TIGR02611 family)